MQNRGWRLSWAPLGASSGLLGPSWRQKGFKGQHDFAPSARQSDLEGRWREPGKGYASACSSITEALFGKPEPSLPEKGCTCVNGEQSEIPVTPSVLPERFPARKGTVSMHVARQLQPKSSVSVYLACSRAGAGFGTASQFARHWHDCPRDQPQCGHLSVGACITRCGTSAHLPI